MLHVIGTGYGRTGTTSLTAALVQLGFGPCLEAGDVFRNPRLIRPLLAAVEGKPTNWEEIFAGYKSTVCEPVTPCWRQVVEYYPEVKVVHTVRDPEQWISSIQGTLLKRRRHINTWYGKVAIRVSSTLGTGLAPLIELFTRTLEGQALKSLAEGKPERAIEQFQAHTDQVIKTVPADRLLIYDIRDEWGPLCEFLGVPVLAEPFPLKSTTAEIASGRGRGFGREALSLFLARTR
jgi:hypothetical protein